MASLKTPANSIQRQLGKNSEVVGGHLRVARPSVGKGISRTHSQRRNLLISRLNSLPQPPIYIQFAARRAATVPLGSPRRDPRVNDVCVQKSSCFIDRGFEQVYIDYSITGCTRVLLTSCGVSFPTLPANLTSKCLPKQGEMLASFVFQSLRCL